MRFSLRALLIALGILPLVIGAVVWNFWPERGSPSAISAFERALASGSKSRLEWAAYCCFVPGLPEKRYQTLLAKAKYVHPGDHFGYPKTAKVYEFPAEEGKYGVLVVVDGQPPIIHSATVTLYSE
jgi:hypothetical protein